ncbi:GNAT family N-acetyltransferase [Uliginosibacterium paludis]|uniref:GNAT family N-acetyltransferase n=1 Tax=Uliginosibacterium paludis TaxID=1615952 RepID=A0ABV2CS89_9RHOO
MTSRTTFLPLCEADTEALLPVLYQEAVFEFIGGLPAKDAFLLDLQRAIEGPPPGLDEQWRHYAVRLADSGALIGRVEVTLHHGLAEIGLLLNPAFWGKGYALEALHWLHGQLACAPDTPACWATVHPDNLRSQGLLRKAGYVSVQGEALPVLYSMDEGDLVFRRLPDATGQAVRTEQGG